MRPLNDIEKMTLRTISPLMCAYDNAKITEELAQTYAIALADIEQAALGKAVLKCLRTHDKFPRISQIRDEVDNITAAITGKRVKSPDEAWQEVVKQMREAFIYKKPVFSTPEIEQAALAMDWTALCLTETENVGTVRAQFLRLYESTCKRKKEERQNNDVIGLTGGNKTAALVGNLADKMPRLE
jgi:hypothetical protein